MVGRIRLGCAASAIMLAVLSGRAEAACDLPVQLDRWDRVVRDACGERVEHAGPRDEPWSLPSTPPLAAPPAVRSFNPARMIDDAIIGNYNQDLGTRGIHAFDSDGDGIPEILVGHGSRWYLLQFEPATGTWVQRLFREYARGSTFGGGPVTNVRAGDVDADGEPEIVVVLADGTLESFNARDGRLETTHSIGVVELADFELADVEGALEAEVVGLTTSDVRVYRVGTPAPLWTVPGVGGTDLAVGDVDTDAAKEIVVAGFAAGQVVDCVLRTAEWAYSTGFGSVVDVGDIDGDGMDEIAGCNNWGSCMAVDGDTRLEKWAFDNFNSGAVRCRDVTGDGILEVGIGDAQWGDVHFRDGLTGDRVAFIPNPEHTVAYIDFADVDGDCHGEVLWGAGYTSTGEDHVFVGNLALREIEWQNIENDGPMNAFVVADIDSDGRTEIVRASGESDAGYGGTLIYVSNLHDRRDERLPPGEISMNWILTQGMAAIQADADPQLEYVISTAYTYDGYVSAFDGVSHDQQWRSVMLDDGSPYIIITGDPDEDGDEDVLIGTNRYWRQLQATDGAVLYRSPDVGRVLDIRVADADADARMEVAFVSSTGLRVFDGRTHFEEWFLPDTDLQALDVADVVPGGSPEILVGDGTGTLIAYAGAGPHAEVFRAALGAGPIHAIRVADVDEDGQAEIVVAKSIGTSSGTSQVMVLQASDRAVQWTSPVIVGSAGVGGSLIVADADDDGQREICVAGFSVLRFFEHDDGVADVAAPTFAGLATAAGIASPTCCPSVDLAWEPAIDDRTPPIRYRVHRGSAPGFAIDASSLIGTTERQSFRDEDVLPGTTYHYAVRAVDAAGNEDANAARRQVTTEDGLPPAEPVITSIRDLDPCAPTGLEIEFLPAAPPPGVRFDLLRDGAAVVTGVTSPVTHVPGTAAPRDYAIAAVKLTCDIRSVSLPSTAADGGAALSAPVVTAVEDVNACLVDGIRVTFAHAGFGSGTGSYDLLLDGLVVATDVTSPVVHVPADSAQHWWAVRALDATCARQADSGARPGTDAHRVPEAPSGVTITDVDPCAPSSARVRFTHGGFPAGGHHELWRDGVVFLAPVVDGQVFPVFDATAHDYVVVAVDDSCALQTASAPVRFADGSNCNVGDPSIRLRKLGASDVEVSWAAVPGDIVRYDAHVGTISRLWTARAYDHVPDRTGPTFPDAASPASGCDFASGPGTSARIGELPAGNYVLLVAVSASLGQGPFGLRSDGVDRGDPSVDPRNPHGFCP